MVGTAQGAFRLMMKNELAPRLRELGFVGSGTHFELREALATGMLDFQASRSSTGEEYDFTVNVSVRNLWMPYSRLGFLTPAMNDSWWRLDPGRPSVAAAEVFEAVRDYAVVALRMTISYPEARETLRPLTESVEIHKTLERERFRRLEWRRLRFGQEELPAPLTEQHTSGRPERSKSELLHWLDSDEAYDREYAAGWLARWFKQDPDVKELFVVWSDDPLWAVRRVAYKHLRLCDRNDPRLIAALERGLDEEDPHIRWDARFALMLFGRAETVAIHPAPRGPKRPFGERLES